MQSLENESALGDYGGLVRRQWPLILLGVLIGGIFGITALGAAPKTYESTTSLIVQPTGDDTNVEGGRTSSTINLDTEAQLVTSTVVAARAAELMHSSLEPRELAKHVAVQVPANTSVLEITFAASSAANAQQGAETFADAYLDNRKDLAQDKVKANVAHLLDTIDSLNADLVKVNDDLQGAISDSRRAYLITQRALLIQQIRTSTSQLGPLQSEDVQPGTVITQAQKPTSPSGLSPLLVLVSGLFIGLLLGLVAAVIRDRSDHRVRSRRDLDRLGLDVLVSRFTLPPPKVCRATDTSMTSPFGSAATRCSPGS